MTKVRNEFEEYAHRVHKRSIKASLRNRGRKSKLTEYEWDDDGVVEMAYAVDEWSNEGNVAPLVNLLRREPGRKWRILANALKLSVRHRGRKEIPSHEESTVAYQRRLAGDEVARMIKSGMPRDKAIKLAAKRFQIVEKTLATLFNGKHGSARAQDRRL